MKALGPLRRALGFSTILNLFGPLTNPAHARTQVIGVLAPSRVLLVGRTLLALGRTRAFVVHGTDGIDELTTTGESVVARIMESEPGAEPALKGARITPEMAGLERTTLDHFTGGDIETNKALLYDVITGIKGARRDIVLLNAAAALVAAGPRRRPEGRRSHGRRSHRLRPGRRHPGQTSHNSERSTQQSNSNPFYKQSDRVRPINMGRNAGQNASPEDYSQGHADNRHHGAQRKARKHPGGKPSKIAQDEILGSSAIIDSQAP